MLNIILWIIPGCFLVGLCIGWTGVAGFLLPILFMTACHFSSSQSLFLSFVCFAISGIIGAANYRKRGELPWKPAIAISLGSLSGSLFGAMIGQNYISGSIKIILYMVVLLSGIMILVQEYLVNRHRDQKLHRQPNIVLLLLIGFLCAVLCALSGAGGPVLVMPILVLTGFSVKTSIGIALFDSIFIALPAVAVYGSHASFYGMGIPIVTAVLAHAAGISLGSTSAGRIPAIPLKRGIAVFSIVFSIWMLFHAIA